jgi:hypothetical protein
MDLDGLCRKNIFLRGHVLKITDIRHQRFGIVRVFELDLDTIHVIEHDQLSLWKHD